MRKIYGQDISEFKKQKVIVVNPDGSVEEKESRAHHWLMRADAMRTRRNFFEDMWRKSLFAFAAFDGSGDMQGKKSFDPDTAPEIQGYFNSKYTTYGFRFTDVRYPLEFAVVMRKLATEIKNIPRPDWRVPGADDQSPAILWKSIYNQAMDEAEGDYEDFETFLQKNIFGTAIRWSRMVSYDNTVQEPEFDAEGEVSWKEKTHKVRDFKSTTVDLRHVFLDEGCTSTTLSDCEDAIVTEYLTEENGKKIYSEVDFDGLGIKAAPKKELFQDINDINGGDTKPFYEVMNCYNEITDTYDVMINGIIVRSSPIPMRSCRGRKKIPVALIIDNKIPGQPYGYGEPAVVRAFREIKNKNRNLIYDVTKKGAKPTLCIDPLSPFSEETYTFGQDFVRVSPKDMAPIPVQSNLDAPLRLDAMTDDDVTMATGINIKDTVAPPSDETATKTVVRKESQVMLVDLGLYLNSVAGLKRLHSINANILRLHLQAPQMNAEGKEIEKEVTTKDAKIFRAQRDDTEVRFIEEGMQGMHTIKYKGEDIDYDFEPVLMVGNIAVSEQLEKNMKMESAERLVALAPQAVDQAGLAEFLRQNGGLPTTVIKTQEKKQTPNPSPDSEEDTIAGIIAGAGGIIPEENQAINDFKNAQKGKVMAEQATSPEAMGGAAAPAGV
jgi:hypothetical protein